MTWQLFTGLDFVAPLDVIAQGSLSGEDVSTTTIVASLLSADGLSEIISDTSQSSSTTGASWSTGRVVVMFSAADTANAASIVGTTALVGIKITTGAQTISLPLIQCDIEKGY